MTKYVRVEEAPESLSRVEAVIRFPDFLEDVRTSKIPRPQSKTFGNHFVRALAEEIATLYEPDFDCFKNIKPHVLVDVEFTSDEDIARQMFNLFASQYPQIFDSCIEAQIKRLPFGTKVVYYVGPHKFSGSFSKHGIESITMKEADDLLGRSADDSNKKKPNHKK